MPTQQTKDTLTFRLHAAKRKELDRVADVLDRDRSYVISEAIETYLDLHRWQLAHIQRGLKQAERREFANEKEIARAFKR